MALVDELGGDDSSRPDHCSIELAHFVHDGEAIALAQVVVKVDVAGKNLGELHGDGVRKADRIRCGEKRRSNLARAKLEPCL